MASISPFQHHLLVLGNVASLALDAEPCNSFKVSKQQLGQTGAQVVQQVLSMQPNRASVVTTIIVSAVADHDGQLDNGSSTANGAAHTDGGQAAHQAEILPLPHLLDVLSHVRQALPASFLILWHPQATENAHVRSEAFIAGANMVTCCHASLAKTLSKVKSQQGTGSATCAWCGLSNLTEQDYWLHQPLYHIYAKERPTHCGLCDKQVTNLPVHVHEEHAPGGPRYESRTNYGNAIVVHRPTDNRFLMVQEFAHQGFWTPGGCADPGETLSASAVRECLEETGIDVKIEGLLEVQHDMSQTPPWRLAVFYAQPIDEHQVPKTVPDYESAGACWVSLEELGNIPLRCPELPYRWFPDIVNCTVQLLPTDKVPEHAAEQFADLTM